MYHKCDGQTFVGGAPIGLGRTLCTSESQESMQGPGIVDVITTAEAGGGWDWGVRVRWDAGHASLDTSLHSPHSAACLVYSPALCHPGMKEIKQDAAVPGGSHHADC